MKDDLKSPDLHPEAKPGEEDPSSPNYDPEAVRLNGAIRALKKLNANREKSSQNGRPLK